VRACELVEPQERPHEAIEAQQNEQETARPALQASGRSHPVPVTEQLSEVEGTRVKQ
jgi:hypothetical protein